MIPIHAVQIRLSRYACRRFGRVTTGDLEFYGRKKQNKITLRALLDAGSGRTLGVGAKILENASLSENINIQVASFLHRELPIRCAHRALELDSSDVFQKSKYAQQVNSWYRKSFQQLLDAPAPIDLQKEKYFAKLIESIYERHSATLITMAKAAHEIRTDLKHDTNSFSEYEEVQHKLDEFYLSRIGIRMMIGQYLTLRNAPATADMIGLISLRCSCHAIAKEAIEDATYMCRRVHGDAPEVIIKGPDLNFAHVPTHLKYILLELLKNSMRATIEKHGVDNPPPIKIIVSDGESNEDVVIKVSDEGGGIKRSNMKRIWSYLFTTGNKQYWFRIFFMTALTFSNSRSEDSGGDAKSRGR